MGYDPIFKSQPGPTAIQPATSGSTSVQPSSTNASPYAPPPQGYLPQAYGQASTSSENPTSQPYDYGAAIDPALGEGLAGQMQDGKGATGMGDSYPQGEPDQGGHRGDSIFFVPWPQIFGNRSGPLTNFL